MGNKELGAHQCLKNTKYIPRHTYLLFIDDPQLSQCTLNILDVLNFNFLKVYCSVSYPPVLVSTQMYVGSSKVKAFPSQQLPSSTSYFSLLCCFSFYFILIFSCALLLLNLQTLSSPLSHSRCTRTTTEVNPCGVQIPE